jgi:hypothetical protein
MDQRKSKKGDKDALNATKSTTLMNVTGPSYHIGPMQHLGVDSPFTIINEEDTDFPNNKLHMVSQNTKYHHKSNKNLAK